jgi:hypothetical protein
MAVLIGRWTVLPTWMFFVVLANASFGGPSPRSPLAFRSHWLPSGATVTSLREAVYFPGFSSVEQNLEVFGFQLTDDEMAKITLNSA